MTTATVSQTDRADGADNRVKLQVLVSPEAAARLRVAAAARNRNPGEVLSEVLEKHLPPVPKESW